MNGPGCKNCPVEKCETMIYRGSVCAAQRAKLSLGDPNDRTDCWQFQDCFYRNDVGRCPENCLQYRHKDYVLVVRCRECRFWTEGRHHTGRCKCLIDFHDAERYVTDAGHFCSYGERRTDG